MKLHFGGRLRISFFTVMVSVATIVVQGAGCSSNGKVDPGGSGGSGGSGGATGSSGGASASSGGATASSGGATTSSGGASASSGGASASSGGASTSSGGASTSSGGASTSSGGASTSSGGASASSGGAGGKASGTGGKAGSSGGAGGKASSLGGAGGKAISSGGAGGTSPDDPLNKRVSCTSGKRSSGLPNENMAPGRPCLDCHSFAVAGTVYPTGHETNDCQGVNDETVMVVLTDVNGESMALPINSVGNFGGAGELPAPFTAKIVRGAAERRMLTPQTNANCNECHTADGKNGAPGRIVVPF